MEIINHQYSLTHYPVVKKNSKDALSVSNTVRWLYYFMILLSLSKSIPANFASVLPFQTSLTYNPEVASINRVMKV
jgi:hypothetical protein